MKIQTHLPLRISLIMWSHHRKILTVKHHRNLTWSQCRIQMPSLISMEIACLTSSWRAKQDPRLTSKTLPRQLTPIMRFTLSNLLTIHQLQELKHQNTVLLPKAELWFRQRIAWELQTLSHWLRSQISIETQCLTCSLSPRRVRSPFFTIR